MYVIKLKNIILFFLIGIIVIYLLLNFIKINNKKVEAISRNYCDVIVIDAGHGFPDSGANVGDLMEADLNLAIAKKLENELKGRGYEIIMTRKDENNIADKDKQGSISTMKASDLENRVNIINNSNADFCISIHMNKFQSSKYWGWQTFYNKDSEDGKDLAKYIQENIKKATQRPNKRGSLKIDGIKIVDKTNIPVVIVECGFISNPEEAQLLQDEQYQLKIVQGIANGIEEFYNKN